MITFRLDELQRLPDEMRALRICCFFVFVKRRLMTLISLIIGAVPRDLRGGITINTKAKFSSSQPPKTIKKTASKIREKGAIKSEMNEVLNGLVEAQGGKPVQVLGWLRSDVDYASHKRRAEGSDESPNRQLPLSIVRPHLPRTLAGHADSTPAAPPWTQATYRYRH